jgi:hypothetical protein
VYAAWGAADASETGGDVIDTSALDPVRTPTAHRSNRNNVDLFEVRSTFWPYREDGYHLVGTADQWQR